MRQNHRRIKRDRLQTIYVKNRTVEKDSEGVPTEIFGEAIELKAEVWAANERRQIETYGDRITNVANVRIQGKYTVNGNATEGITIRCERLTDEQGDVLTDNELQEITAENRIAPGDGVCINVSSADSPDYRVLTITPSRPVRLEIERI